MQVTDKIKITNEDNMELMARYPDKYFELAIVDPPYGIGKKLLLGGKTGVVKFHEQYALNEWDNEIPKKEYFEELFRVSKNQIIWGGNYFIEFLRNTRGIIFWDKNLGEPNNFSHFELAWTSFDCIARKYVKSSNSLDRIHPTQKPVSLYKWLLENYAKEGEKILDTHLGSGSIAIACHDYGYELTACELDKEYYENAIKRIKKHTAQQKLF
jgi:site-specific DNA-methyltransferase (adenine-specific)